MGSARVERDLPDLGDRFKRKEIVVLDMRDLDRVTAESLVHREAAAVINASASISGRYPNLGPQILANAGIILLDFVGPEIMHLVSDGDKLRIDGSKIYRGDDLIATGAVLDAAYVRRLLEDAKAGVSTQLQNLAANAAEQLRREQALFLEGVGLPRLTTTVKGRPVVVVDRAYDFESDLKGLKRFIKQHEPVMIGAGRGSEAVLAAGHRLDVVIGEPLDISQRSMREAADVVLVGSTSQDSGLDKLEKADKEALRIKPAASPADLAMLIADANGASVVVSVGSHTSLVEFLDRSQTDMAGSFLTRMRMSGKLVDAKAINAISDRSSHWMSSLVVIGGGIVALGAAIATTSMGAELWSDSLSWIDSSVAWIQGLFG